MPNEKELDPRDWDNITEDDLKVLANLKDFLDKEKEIEKEKIREIRRIWDDALDMANAPEIFGYNVPLDE